MTKNAYKEAGVDIDAGAALVDRIKEPVKRTNRTGIIGGIGGFGALFDLKETGFKDPLIVSATDGVGTKLMLAHTIEKHDTVGIDLVAMCVNDLVTLGAEPLFFLDYFACGSLDVDQAADVINGIATGCELAGCALVGGETAEMPGMYKAEDYDLAGFAVGAVERVEVIDGQNIKPGDVLLGLASSGPHSNGYSLIRHVIKNSGLSYNEPAPFSDDRSLGQALLEPTKIYIKSLLDLCAKAKEEDLFGSVKAFAHITGGGLTENIARILPRGLSAKLDAGSWAFLPVYSWLKQAGDLSVEDMSRTFNCGLGMVVVCDSQRAALFAEILESSGETVSRVGEITEGNVSVQIKGMEEAWR